MSRHLDDLTKSLVAGYAEKLSKQKQELLAECLQVIADDKKYNKFGNFFPDEGEFRRELYPMQIAFFDAGATYDQRGLIAANQVGKSEAGAYEARCHATGDYPHWWTGKRFNKPTLGWIGGDTATTVRDIIQVKLIGDDITDMGTGMFKKEDIIVEQCKTRRNVPDALEILKIRHVSGGVSTIVLKTYEQGRKIWQGTVVDWIWVDEECPEEVYGEALIRLMNSNGIIFTTFTPLSGMTDLVMTFLDNSQDSDSEVKRYVGICTWDDVPHISAETKRKMLASTPPHLRKARSKGEPGMGTGLVYPIDTDDIVIKHIDMPKHYKRIYGFDVGWNNTAALWAAWDEKNDVIYIYAEHKMGHVEPVVHVAAIKAKGEKIPGVIDPASRGRSQIDGEKLYDIYQDHGLNIYPANNAVDAGIFTIWERMITGRLKILDSCQGLLRELSLYHRDDKGRIVKKHDHLLDALRYLINAEPYLWGYLLDGKRKQVIPITNHMTAWT